MKSTRRGHLKCARCARQCSMSSRASSSDGATPGCELDDRQHDLAPLGVGHADHRDVADGRMREQLGLDLGRDRC